MKKVLILGASILQLPAILKAKELGYYVGAVDYNPAAIGIAHADEYFNTSTIDIDGVVQIAKAFKPDGIMTLATDMPIRAVARACEICGLPGISYDTAVRATDKGEMIKAFDANGVEHPWYYIADDRKVFESIVDKVSFPCVMKPTDNAGSRGVVLCHGPEELKQEYDYSCGESRSGAVIIEEYLRGPEFSVEVMVIDGEPHVLQITDKMTTGAPHFVEMGHSQPSKQPESVQTRIKDLACRAVKAVGINIGPAHVEMILTGAGPKMVELGARMGGDCITSHLVPLSTGIDMVGAAIRLACGESADIRPVYRKGAAIRYFCTEKGTIRSIENIEQAKSIPGVREISFVHGPGEVAGEIGNSADRIGFVISQADTAEAAIKACENAIETVSINIDTVIRSEIMDIRGKKLLVLGGTSASLDLVKLAQSMGVYTVVTDDRDKSERIAKQLADDHAMVSTTDIDGLIRLIRERHIDGAFCGPSEFNIRNLIKLCKAADLPCYTTMETWNRCANKDEFTACCRRFGVDVPEEFDIHDGMTEAELDAIDYPIIIKPVDGCSSIGISVCRRKEDVMPAFQKAMNASTCKRIIAEKYIENGGELFGARYLVQDGEAYPYLLIDTYVADPVKKTSLISAYTHTPSKYSDYYMANMDKNVRAMIRGMGIKTGTVFFQSLPFNGKIYFHEMGYRLSGGMLYKLTEPLMGINDMKMMIRSALGGACVLKEEVEKIDLKCGGRFGGQLMIPLNAGTIGRIEGLEEAAALPAVTDFIQYYKCGDTVKDSYIGTLQQHFGRFTMIADNEALLNNTIKKIQSSLVIYNNDNIRMNILQFDLNRLN